METYEAKCRYCRFVSDSLCACNRCEAIRHSWFCTRQEEIAFQKEKELDIRMLRRTA